MWELKKLSNPDYVEAFKDGAAFAIVVILISGLLITAIILLTRFFTNL